MRKRLIITLVLLFSFIAIFAGRVWTSTGSKVNIIGYNGAVGATAEPIWMKSGAMPALLTSSEQLKINSSNANDDGSPAGTGARTIKITGLDSNYQVLSETITMNGTSDVTSSSSFLRVNFVEVVTAGSGGVPAGNISILNNAKSVTLGYLPAGINYALQAIYTVPANTVLFISDIFLGELESKDTNVKIVYREQGSNYVWKELCVFHVLDDMKNIQLKTELKFKQKTDIYLSASSAGGSGVVSAGMIGYLD